MNTTQITSNNIASEVICNTSKSHANRVLIACALSREAKVVKNLSDAQDVKDMLRILSLIGVEIKESADECIIHNSFPDCEISSSEPVFIDGSEGGTTMRFLLPLLSLGKNEYHIQLKGSLVSRPMDEILDSLKKLGAYTVKENDLIKIKGPLRLDKKIKIDCSQTTQFASALLLLQIHQPFELEMINLSFSETYIELTKKVIDEVTHSGEIEISPDFSSLGYFIAYGLTQQNIHIKNVKEVDSFQADSYFFKLMDDLKISYILSENGLLIPKSEYNGFHIDSSLCIDLVPTLIYLACFAKGPSTFTNLAPLKLKESDRLEEMMNILNSFRMRYEFDRNALSLKVFPYTNQNSIQHPLDLVVADDHRMVMVGTLFLKKFNGGSICPSYAVAKSFPKFFSYFK